MRATQNANRSHLSKINNSDKVICHFNVDYRVYFNMIYYSMMRKNSNK